MVLCMRELIAINMVSGEADNRCRDFFSEII